MEEGQEVIRLSLTRQAYYVQTELGYFKVFRIYDASEQPPVINVRESEHRGRWMCSCHWQEKTGVTC